MNQFRCLNLAFSIQSLREDNLGLLAHLIFRKNSKSV